MEKSSSNWGLYIAAIAFPVIAVYFSQNIEQPDFYPMLGCFSAFFILYLLIWYAVKTEKEVWFFIAAAIFTRIVLVFALPNLSDDFYRFIWDGRLTNLGINPFLFTPEELIAGGNIDYYNGSAFDVSGNLNSMGYYTVYPPVNQAVFALSAFLFPKSVFGATVVMKLVFLLAEIGTIFLAVRLIGHLKLPSKTVLLYGLNPLIILESFNNLHFEIVLIFFLMLGFWFLAQNKWMWSAVAMAFAIGTKLLPLMFLPFLILYLGWKQSVRYFLMTGIILLLLFMPILNGKFIDGFGESIGLYFQKFEFNGSIYYGLRWLGYKLAGYNIIAKLGPLLGLATMIFVFWRAFWHQDSHLERLILNCMLAMTAFLLCSTTVHPWYLSSIIFMCVFTGYRYPLVWSGLILLTYINYSFATYAEFYPIVWIEYLVLALFMWYEWKHKEFVSFS